MARRVNICHQRLRVRLLQIPAGVEAIARKSSEEGDLPLLVLLPFRLAAYVSYVTVQQIMTEGGRVLLNTACCIDHSSYMSYNSYKSDSQCSINLML